MRGGRSKLWRLAKILWVLVRHGLAHALGNRLPRWGALARRLPPGDLSPPVRLRQILEEIGGTFVKLGQILALQPDILPLAYCNALFELLDRMQPFPFSEVERVFAEELGRGPDEFFDHCERQALATASVGQVHLATLEGRRFAVKVQRPDVDLGFGSDIRLMAGAVWLIERLRLRSLSWLVEPTTEFIAWTREEIDFRYEARYAERLRRHAQSNPKQIVPEVLSRFTSRRVLVTEFLDGVPLIDYLRARESGDELRTRRLEPAGFDRRQFAANLIDNFLGDVFHHGFYHADLHPANLLILEDNVVGYVDFGITGVMSHHARRHLVAMTLALAVGDMDALNRHFLRVSGYGDDADLEHFREGLETLARGWYTDEEGDGGQELCANFTRIMGEMLTLSRQTGVLPERDIVKYIRSAIAIDGLITRFEPSFEVGQHLADSCARHLAWQGRREMFSSQNLLDWSVAGSRLLLEGPERFINLLDRATDDGQKAKKTARNLPAHGRATTLALAALAVTLLLAWQPTARPGLNLQTAEWCFALTTAVLSFFSLGKTAS